MAVRLGIMPIHTNHRVIILPIIFKLIVFMICVLNKHPELRLSDRIPGNEKPGHIHPVARHFSFYPLFVKIIICHALYLGQ